MDLEVMKEFQTYNLALPKWKKRKHFRDTNPNSSSYLEKQHRDVVVDYTGNGAALLYTHDSPQ